MARGDQLGRQWQILQILLSARLGKTAAELANLLECNLRTLYRDLEALQMAGFPLYTERTEGKNRWYLLDTVKHSIPIPFSLTELMALYFSQGMLKTLKDTVYYDALESLFKKIKTNLPRQSLQYLEKLQQTLQVGVKHYKAYGKFQGTLALLQDAALSRKSVEMVYFTMSRKAESKRKVDPYKIWFFNGTFYLIGYCHRRGEVRIFAIDRIKSVQQTEDPFEIPESFNLKDLLSASFGVFKGPSTRVKVWFDASVAGYIIEKIWHESQKIRGIEDGSIIFEAEVAGTDEIKFWILSWGANALVLGPDSLREEIRRETLAMIERYDRMGTESI